MYVYLCSLFFKYLLPEMVNKDEYRNYQKLQFEHDTQTRFLFS